MTETIKNKVIFSDIKTIINSPVHHNPSDEIILSDVAVKKLFTDTYQDMVIRSPRKIITGSEEYAKITDLSNKQSAPMVFSDKYKNNENLSKVINNKAGNADTTSILKEPSRNIKNEAQDNGNKTKNEDTEVSNETANDKDAEVKLENKSSEETTLEAFNKDNLKMQYKICNNVDDPFERLYVKAMVHEMHLTSLQQKKIKEKDLEIEKIRAKSLKTKQINQKDWNLFLKNRNEKIANKKKAVVEKAKQRNFELIEELTFKPVINKKSEKIIKEKKKVDVALKKQNQNLPLDYDAHSPILESTVKHLGFQSKFDKYKYTTQYKHSLSPTTESLHTYYTENHDNSSPFNLGVSKQNRRKTQKLYEDAQVRELTKEIIGNFAVPKSNSKKHKPRSKCDSNIHSRRSCSTYLLSNAENKLLPFENNMHKSFNPSTLSTGDNEVKNDISNPMKRVEFLLKKGEYYTRKRELLQWQKEEEELPSFKPMVNEFSRYLIQKIGQNNESRDIVSKAGDINSTVERLYKNQSRRSKSVTSTYISEESHPYKNPLDLTERPTYTNHPSHVKSRYLLNLYQHSQEKYEKLEKLKLLKEQKELAECTFRPNISSFKKKIDSTSQRKMNGVTNNALVTQIKSHKPYNNKYSNNLTYKSILNELDNEYNNSFKSRSPNTTQRHIDTSNKNLDINLSDINHTNPSDISNYSKKALSYENESNSFRLCEHLEKKSSIHNSARTNSNNTNEVASNDGNIFNTLEDELKTVINNWENMIQ